MTYVVTEPCVVYPSTEQMICILCLTKSEKHEAPAAGNCPSPSPIPTGGPVAKPEVTRSGWVAGVELATASEPPARRPRIWGPRPAGVDPCHPELGRKPGSETGTQLVCSGAG